MLETLESPIIIKAIKGRDMSKIDEYIIEHWQDTIKEGNDDGLTLPYLVILANKKRRKI